MLSALSGGLMLIWFFRQQRNRNLQAAAFFIERDIAGTADGRGRRSFAGAGFSYNFV